MLRGLRLSNHIARYYLKNMSSCDACVAKDIPTLTAEELSPLMATLHLDWKVAADHKAISRFFKAKDFLEALRYVNAAAAICEEANHHADFHLTNWTNVLVEISTHSAGALTINGPRNLTRLLLNSVPGG